MPHVFSDDGVRLHYEEVGSGTALVFLHEFGGDHRSWEPQVREFSRNYRCIVPAARGFPPSDVPAEELSYSQQHAVNDVAAVLNSAGIDRAFLVGNSMGAFAALHFTLQFPERTLGALIAGCGYGAHPDHAPAFRQSATGLAATFEKHGAETAAHEYGFGPARVQFASKDPRGHAEHIRILSEHNQVGAANTLRRVQGARPSLYGMQDELAACVTPVLVVVGDEDEAALDASLMLKRTMSRCGLAVLPRSGHVTNLEEVMLFNSMLQRFIIAVENGGWKGD